MKRSYLLICFLATALTSAVANAAPSNVIRLQASQGQLLGGVKMATQIPGYTGSGYVAGFTKANSEVVMTIPHAKAGIYNVTVRYSSPDGQKGYNLVVNGAASSNMFTKTGNGFASSDAGKVELHAGANTVAIQGGWDYYDIDSVTLTPAAPAPLPLLPPMKLADPDATPPTRALMRYLIHHYGRRTISGQYDPSESDYIQQVSGRTPAIIGGDFMNYSPSRVANGENPKGETEKMIAAAKTGQIVTMSWHWNAPTDLLNTTAEPWWKGFYTSATTFDVQDALAHPGSKNCNLLLSNMDTIAAQLQKFNKAGIPVLWRPLHEAQGGWFWWGAKGPEAFKQLWRLMFNRFTYHDHLHNLIWVDCSGTNPAWYPGDKYVDIIGIDEYPSDLTEDSLSADWQTLQKQYNGKKLVALTEFGGVPDVPKMYQFGVRWSYFVSWTGADGPHKMAPSALKSIYDSPLVITKSDLARTRLK